MNGISISATIGIWLIAKLSSGAVGGQTDDYGLRSTKMLSATICALRNLSIKLINIAYPLIKYPIIGSKHGFICGQGGVEYASLV